MAQSDHHLGFIYREFEKRGVTDYRLQTNRGAHDRIVWSHHDSDGILTVAKTPSDRRGVFNLRSDLRHQLDRAGIAPVADTPRRKPLKPVSSAQPDNGLEQRVNRLSGDVDVITDTLLELAPALDRINQLATQAEQTIQDTPVKFQLRTIINPSMVGQLLAYLLANGVAMPDIKLSAINGAKAPEAATPAPAVSQRPAPVEEPRIAAPVPSPAPAPVSAPETLAKPKKYRGRVHFKNSALAKLMVFLRDNGPQTTEQLRLAGFIGYGGRADRLHAFAYTLTQKDLGHQRVDGRWEVNPEGKRLLRVHKL